MAGTGILQRKCQHCKVGSLEEDECGAETALICTNCGLTSGNVVLRAPDSEEGYTFTGNVCLKRKYRVNIDSDSIHPSKLAMIRNMKHYLGNYPPGDELSVSAEELFLASLKECVSQGAGRPGKIATYAAASVVTVLRDYGIHVSLKKVAAYFGISLKDLNRKVRFIKENYSKNTRTLHIDQLIDNYLKDYPETDAIQPVKKCAIHLCELLTDVSLSCNPDTMAIIAIYNAIVSREKKIPRICLTKFCEKMSLRLSANLSGQVQIARNKLIILAKRLPWVSCPVTNKNYHTFIDSILKYKSVIFDKDWNGNDENKTADFDDSIDKESNAKTVITDQMRLELPDVSIRNILKPPPVSVPEQEVPFKVSNSEIIDENDLPESELNEYIRSEEEVAIFKKIQNFVEKSQSC